MITNPLAKDHVTYHCMNSDPQPFDDIFRAGCVVSRGQAIMETGGGLRTPVTFQRPMDLLIYKSSIGDCTVFIDNISFLFAAKHAVTVQKFIELFESPDFFGKRYHRPDYPERAILFIGDAEARGMVWSRPPAHYDHGALMRAVKRDGVAVATIGSPAIHSLTAHMCGAILLGGGDVDATYISLWTPGAAQLRPFINQLLANLAAPGPFKYDENIGADFEGPFRLTDW